MTTLELTRCDGLGCEATTAAGGHHDGWMALSIAEWTTDMVYYRKADLCPVHVQAFLDVCGPLPRRN